MDVDLIPVPALLGESIAIGKYVGCKVFVEFDQLYLGKLPTDLRKQFGYGLGGRSEHELRIHRRLRVANDLRQWSKVVIFGVLPIRDDHRGCAVIHGGGVTGSDFSVRSE